VSFLPHRSRASLKQTNPAAAAFVAWPMVDSLYDFTAILSDKKPIATVPKALWGTRVAVVGAGAAGIVAAYELFRAGLHPVIFEATNRIGGRNYSRPFGGDTGKNAALAELGAMRVPPSCKVFNYYYEQVLKLKFSPFPDPGKVLTTLYYQNQPYTWLPSANPHDPAPPPPGPFARIATDFGNFADGLTTPLWAPWQAGDLEGVRRVWQRYIQRYADISFLTALAQGIPAWGPAELNAFGALGMGSGGFGPLYGVGFLEMLRMMCNQWEVDQQLPQFGISGLTEGLYARKVKRPDGSVASLADIQAVRLESPVTRFDRKGRTVTVHFTADGRAASETFPAVIVATTSHAMSFMGLTLPSEPGSRQMLNPGATDALRNLPMMNSSKLFIRTKDKFWKGNKKMPQNIQTDELPRGIYCLDYPQTDNGVVLISYTWGDDSTRLIASPPATRFAVFKQILSRINPDFAAALVPVDGEILAIDWEGTDHYFGAFKLNQPGQEPNSQEAYYQFLDVLTPASDTGIYLAGDSVSWAGGWTEGALHTGLNAAAAVAKRIGATLPPNSPLSQKKDLYSYGGSLI
jgi:tryptophan 2-monooxygenase